MKSSFIATVIVGSLVTSQVYAQSGRQFDLLCEGTIQTVIGGPREPWRGRVKVDLVNRALCRDDCRVIRDIKEVTASRITVSDSSAYNEYIDRVGGQYLHFINEAVGSMIVHQEIIANCDATKFTGMNRKF